MKIAIVGLGALGITFATFLKNSGNTVYGIIKKQHQEKFKNNLVKVVGIWGKHTAYLDQINISSNIKNYKFDLIIITVKSYDTKTALEQIEHLVGKDTLILIAQNGFGNYELAVEMFGKEKILLSRVIFGAKLIDFNTSQITVSTDVVRVGDPSKTIPTEKIINIVNTIKNSGIPTEYEPDVYQVLWDKILYNCALNPLGALLECTYGELSENKSTRIIMNDIIKEIFSVIEKNKIFLKYKNYQEYLNFFYEKLIPPTSKHYPSMYYDLKKRKKTEIDALNGAIVNLAEKKGIKAPVNKTITQLIKFKEISK